MFLDNLRLALFSIGANRLRAGLTVTGVMVGVLSVTLIISLGRAVEREVSGSIDALGANMVFVYPTPDLATASRNVQLTERDAEAIRSRVPEVLRTAVLVSGQARAVAGTATIDTSVRGTDASYFQVVRLSVVEGRTFTAAEVRTRSNVAVIGRTVAEELFEDEPALGRRIRLNGVSTTVVGVVATSGGAVSADPNDFVLTPISTARQRFGLGGGATDQVSMILVEFPLGADLALAQSDVVALLQKDKRISPDVSPPFGTSSTEDLARTTSSLVNVVQAFLAAIASISIFVGGIGITNIMLVSVHERTREIGLRMAVGARRRDIRTQFLTESALLCVVGGMCGVVLAAVIATAITLATDFDVSIRLDHVLWAFLLSILIGVAAGYLPARKAALLDPIEALRRE